MDGELEELHTTSISTCVTNITNPAVHVLDSPIFNVSISALNEDGDKTDYTKFEAVTTTDLLPVDAVISGSSSGSASADSAQPQGVDVASSRLVLSVGDAITVRQVALGEGHVSLADGHVSLGSVTNATELQNAATHFLVHAGLHTEGDASELFEVENVQLDCGQLAVVSPDSIQLIAADTQPSPPPKRKGGWPKGRKRKKEKSLLWPKAPASAYVIYTIPRRQKIKELNPDLPFVEVTKVLGNEWSCMCPLEKQKYFELASEDKSRYIDELGSFQQSDAYQEHLKRKRIRTMFEEENGIENMEGCNFLEDLEEEGLFCKACNQYFSSAHNRKEHMFGKQHLQNVTSEFEEFEKQHETREGAPPLAVPDELANDLLAAPEPALTGDEFITPPAPLPQPPDVDTFIQQFMQRNYDREFECSHLRKTVNFARDDNFILISKIKDLQCHLLKIQSDLATAKGVTVALNTQIDALRMVPTLFGVINF